MRVSVNRWVGSKDTRLERSVRGTGSSCRLACDVMAARRIIDRCTREGEVEIRETDKTIIVLCHWLVTPQYRKLLKLLYTKVNTKKSALNLTRRRVSHSRVPPLCKYSFVVIVFYLILPAVNKFY